MSDEIDKKELIEYLAEALDCWKREAVSTDEKIQGHGMHDQIVQIIKLHFSEDWQQVKKDLGKFMQGKKVTEEYVKRWADFWNDDFHGTLSSHVEPHVRQMLEEAGVEVVEK